MIKHIMAAAICWCAVVSTFPLYAQQAAENTLGSLWLQVEQSYVGIDAKMASIEAAKLHQRAVKGNMLPQISAQAQNTYGTYEGSPGAFFPQPGFFNVSGSPSPLDGRSTTANTFGSAVIEWEIFSFGKLRNQVDAAGALYEQSISDKDAYLLQLKKLLSERYIVLLYNDAKWQWTAKNSDRLNDIRKITAGLSASGLRPAADSLLASSSYVQAMGDRDKWYGLKNAAYIKLLELYGKDTVQYSESTKRFESPATMSSSSTHSIRSSHPLLDVMGKQYDYYTWSGQAQKKASLPSISVLGGYAHRGTGIHSNGSVSGAWKDGFNNTSNNFLVGVGIKWNITGLHTNRLKSEQLYKQAENTKLLQSQYKQALQADLTASQTKIVQQYAQLQKSKLAVKQSKDAYEMYLARYRSGLITLSELLQIRSLLEQAENAQIEASRDYWMLLAYEAQLTADFDFLFNNL